MSASMQKTLIKDKVTDGVWLFAGILGMLGLLTPNPELSLAAGFSLALFVNLLWRPGEPPVLLLVIGWQWLQVVMKIFHANAEGVAVNALNVFHGDLEIAILLSLAALLVLVLGMRFGVGKYRVQDSNLAKNQAAVFSVRKLFFLYLAAVVVSLILGILAWKAPGLTQICLALANLKWVVFFLLVYVCLLRKGYSKFLLAAVIMELTIGIGGYFSDFKTVFFVTIVAFVASGNRLSQKQIAGVAVLIFFTFMLAWVWTAVKHDYRLYLSGGKSAQVVTRGYGERMGTLFEMVYDLNGRKMTQALEDMAERIAYVDYFGRVLVVVPNIVAHEEGKLWGGAFSHIFMPRLFFPDKPALESDSKITQRYTRMLIAGESQGTSISIGYVAESYVDFGPIGMFVPIFILGSFYGWIVRYFFTRRRAMPLAIGYGLSFPVLLSGMLFETTNTKVLGGVVTAFLAAYVVQKLLLSSPVLLNMLKDKRAMQNLYRQQSLA